MHGTTNGEDIFCEIDCLLNKYGLPFNKLVHIVNDGAPTMMGTKMLCGKSD
jgi:hypothetical protein